MPKRITMSTPPFLPGDRVRVNSLALHTTSAPRDWGLLYVKDCEPIWDRPSEGKANWRVTIVGKPGFRPRGGQPSGSYNASNFDLVCRDPADPARK